MEFEIPSWGEGDNNNSNNNHVSKINSIPQKKRKRVEEKTNNNQKEELKNSKVGPIQSNSSLQHKKKALKREKRKKIKQEQRRKEEEEEEDKEEKKENRSQKKKEEENKYETMKEKLKQKIGDQKNQKKMSPLQEKMKERLAGGQFRWLNEQLYTTTGSQSFQTLQKDPSLFDIYHSGFQMQVDKWPVNPLDEMIKYVSSLASSKVVADFGCGEARLAQSVSHKVYSFDLHSPNPHVIACDMSKVPLEDETVDVAIFCLSLMGTNYLDFVKEARRVLRPKGIIKIAEVKSRINEENEIKKFTNQIVQLGFRLSSMDSNNKMFISFQFNKVDQQKNNPKPNNNETTAVLKPCIYKRR